jgi:hypothetical protein
VKEKACHERSDGMQHATKETKTLTPRAGKKSWNLEILKCTY